MNKMSNYEIIPKVAVLLSTYNGERFLPEQIESLNKQIGVEISVLVRDDGSTDNTVNLLRTWETQGIDWYKGRNLNAAKSYLDLIEKVDTTYDYYAFCDQDDVWDDNKLQSAIDALEKFPSTVPALYCSSLRLVDEQLNIIKVHNINEKRNSKARYIFSNIAGCTMVFNKSLLEMLKLHYPTGNIIMHDSWVYKVCLALGGNIYIDHNSHINYRQHGNNVCGMGQGIKRKMKIRFNYLFRLKVKSELQCILDGYSNYMIAEYKEFTELVCSYDQSFRSYFKLLFNQDIDFNHFGLNLLFRLKVILLKL